MAYDFLYEVKDGVATVTFNRPDRLNALTFEIYAQFRDLMADLRHDDAVRVVLETQRGSVSLLQRRLAVGFSRAARLIDMMAEAGVVGPYAGSQARRPHLVHQAATEAVAGGDLPEGAG